MRRGIVALSVAVLVASAAHAAPGDPRLIQGVLEWPAKLTGKPDPPAVPTPAAASPTAETPATSAPAAISAPTAGPVPAPAPSPAPAASDKAPPASEKSAPVTGADSEPAAEPPRWAELQGTVKVIAGDWIVVRAESGQLV